MNLRHELQERGSLGIRGIMDKDWRRSDPGITNCYTPALLRFRMTAD
jgi:hypothetical protein